MGAKRREALNATSETHVLWMALLVIDTLFTFLGVAVRDLGDKGFCTRDGSSDANVTDVNVNARNARAAMYSLAIIVFVIIAWGAAPLALWLKSLRSGRDFHWIQGPTFENIIKDCVIGISGALYLAGDNLFILMDANNVTASGIHAHEVQSYLLGTSIVLGAAVYLIPKVFDVYYESEDDDDGGVIELQNSLGLSLKWAKFTLLALVLDGIFTVIVNGVEETTLGCPSLETTRSDVGFYAYLVAACLAVFAIFGITSCFRCKKLLSNDGMNLGGCCGVTLLAIVTSVFIPLYIAFSNDFPWFCFAENDDSLCAWVVAHLMFLGITLALSIMIFVVGIVVWAIAIYRT